MNTTTTEYLYHNDSTLYSHNDHYEEKSNSQNFCNKYQLQQQQLNFDCDEDTQYSLSEFSQIHLVDGESTENDNFNNCFININNTESNYSTLNFSLNNVKLLQNSVNTFIKNSNSGTNNLDINQSAILNNNRKRTLSFSTNLNESPMPLINKSTIQHQQQTQSINSQNNNNNNNIKALNTNGNNNEKQRIASKICRVCGDKAYSYNFNVITCESCKAFFRRNANKEKEIRCPFNEQCDITTVSRRFCQKCRLQKCFRVGMKKEWIMTEEERFEKKQRIQNNRERRLAERKQKNDSVEETINTSIYIKNTNNLSESAKKHTNTELISNNKSTETAAVAAAHQLFREQQQTTSILLDSSKKLSIKTVQPSSINIVNQQNNINSSALIQPNVQPISLIPSIMNVRSSTDIDVANHNVTQKIVAAAAAAQFNTKSPQQHLENIAKTIVSQQQQLEQMGQSLQQQTTNEQNSTLIDQQTNVLSAKTNNNINLNQQQQNASQTFMEQVAQSLVNQQHQQQQFDKAIQSFAVQNNQQNLSIGVNDQIVQSCITTTTAICPTFCTNKQVTSSHNQFNNNNINSPTDATMAVAAAAVAVAAAQNQQHHQVEHANLAAVVQQHQIMQQQAAVQQFQKLQNQQIIAQQQQVVAVQQQIAAAVAAASCIQPSSSPVISNNDIGTAAVAAAVAANQPQQIVNTTTHKNSLPLSNNQSFVLDPTALDTIANIPPSQTIITSTSSTLSTQQAQNLILPQLMELPNAASQPSISQDMVTVPKEILIKLVEHKIESDQQQQQSEAKQIKCQCHCHCGRYPSDMLIVDKVMADLLENSSKNYSSETRRNSSFQSTSPTPDQLMTNNNNLTNTSLNFTLLPLNQSTFYSGQILKQQTTSNLDPNNSAIETVKINTDYCKLSLCDEENLSELLRANEIWNLEPGETQYGVTENGLRRLIKTISSIATFRLLDRNDQTLLLKHGCESYFILRSITSFNENKIQFLLQNGVSENTINFYKDFPIEWRKNITVILLLGMILLFNPEIPDLNNKLTITMENLKYQSILKRVLYTLCGNDIQITAQIFNTLLSKLEHLKAAATLCTLENVEQIFEPISISVNTSGNIIGITAGPSNNIIYDNLT